MIIIAGLGNPTKQYEGTRHNAGFRVIDKIADDYGISINKKEFKGLCGSGYIEGQKVLLLKPQTFMNLSGESIKEAIDFYKIQKENIIIIYDDMDVKPGTIKIRKIGGPGSHNGMKSVIQNIKDKEFTRIRVGIGKPENKSDMIKYVIGNVSESDKKILDEATTIAKDAVIEILENGVDKAMNKYN